MFEVFFFGGTRLVSGMSEAYAATTSEYRTENKFLVAAVLNWSIHPKNLLAGNKENMQLDTDQTSETTAAQYCLCVNTVESASISR